MTSCGDKSPHAKYGTTHSFTSTTAGGAAGVAFDCFVVAVFVFAVVFVAAAAVVVVVVVVAIAVAGLEVVAVGVVVGGAAKSAIRMGVYPTGGS